VKQGIYIVGAEPGSGKSVIVLGVMEMLSGRMGKVGFFRPVVRDERKPDNITTLIIKRYGLDLSYEKLYGCGYDIARDMLTRDRDEDLLKMILGKYRDLERQCDLIVCTGTDYEGSAIPLEFDFNAKLANNLGCLVLPVVQGYGRDTMEVVSAAQSLLGSLEERKCDSLALVANRVQASLVDAVAGELKRVLPPDIPSYVLPELPILAKPTVGEIAAALDAERLSGQEGSFDREVRNFRIAAMELPNFLERIGTSDSRLKHRWLDPSGHWEEMEETQAIPDHREGFSLILEVSGRARAGTTPEAVLGVGHRVVHGGERFKEPAIIDDRTLEAIRQLFPLAPLHNPANLTGIEVMRELLPDVPQVAVFDTAFHQTMQPKAFLYALPYAFYRSYGVRRYGFHGTSHQYVAREAARHLGRPLAMLNLITLHLGNGASATAIESGKSIDTSMGLTPLEGLIMGTRCGDLDPAVPFYLAGKTGKPYDEIEGVLNRESGLKKIGNVQKC